MYRRMLTVLAAAVVLAGCSESTDNKVATPSSTATTTAAAQPIDIATFTEKYVPMFAVDSCSGSPACVTRYAQTMNEVGVDLDVLPADDQKELTLWVGEYQESYADYQTGGCLQDNSTTECQLLENVQLNRSIRFIKKWLTDNQT